MSTSSESPCPDTQEVLRVAVPSRLCERDLLIQTILGRLEAQGCRVDPFFDRLCLDEAISNAILHGNREDSSKKVRVRVFCSGKRWGVEVKDEGQGFDWEDALRRAAEGPDADRPSGRGIALMVASGADVRFLDGGSRVVISRECHR